MKFLGKRISERMIERGEHREESVAGCASVPFPRGRFEWRRLPPACTAARNPALNGVRRASAEDYRRRYGWASTVTLLRSSLVATRGLAPRMNRIAQVATMNQMERIVAKALMSASQSVEDRDRVSGLSAIRSVDDWQSARATRASIR